MEIKSKHLIFFLLGNLFARIAVVLYTNLGVDEAYYFTYALLPGWSYFDHPPMIGQLILLTTMGLHFTSELFVRLGSLILGTFNLFLVYFIGKQLFNRSTGMIAMLLTASSAYNSIVAGAFILPDTPMSSFWLLSILFATYFIKNKQNKFLLLFGLSVGFAMLSKYLGVFLWCGLLLYFIVYDKKQFRNPYLYISIGISLLIFSPVIYWNLENRMVSFIFHSERAQSSLIKLKFPIVEIVGQIAYNNPVNFVIIVTCLILYLKNKKFHIKEGSKMLLAFSLPLIFIVLFLAFFINTLPHWSSPAYYGLILLSATIIEQQAGPLKKKFIMWIFFANILLIAACPAGIVNFYTGFIPAKHQRLKEDKGHGDFSLDMYGYDQAAMQISKWLDRYEKKNGEQLDLITQNWFPGGQLEYYLAYPRQTKLYVCGLMKERHHFSELNDQQGVISEGCSACFISVSTYYKPLPIELSDLFEKVEKREVIPIIRNKKIAYYIFLYPLIGAKTDIDVNSLFGPDDL